MDRPRRRRPRRVRSAVCLAAVLFGSGLAAESAAHTRSLSYSSWTLSGPEADVLVRVPRIELTRLGRIGTRQPNAPELGDYLSRHLRLRAGRVVCPPIDAPRPRRADPGWVAFAWRVRCASAASIVLESDILIEVAPSHLHFARVALADGQVIERVLTRVQAGWPIVAEGTPSSAQTASTRGTTLFEYVAIGTEHILSGWDHLAFVLALILLATTLGEVARLVTGFTVGHSVTLALAVLGLARPDAAAVEAMIAFSVALVAAENGWLLAGRDRRVPIAMVAVLVFLAVLRAMGHGSLAIPALAGLSIFTACHFGLLARSRRPERLRAALAFAFGLVHGFGFAGVLAEMQLPVHRLAPALFGFNIGVELGQLGVVALIWPALRLLAKAAEGRWQRAASELGSAAICGLGLFWLIARALGS